MVTEQVKTKAPRRESRKVKGMRDALEFIIRLADSRANARQLVQPEVIKSVALRGLSWGNGSHGKRKAWL